jgi:peroxiredoxin Q/BCP
MAIEPGMPAPDFTASTDSGGTLSLKDFHGKTVVLYFYPKDNTSGCTKQACDFRDSMDRITETGAVVIGVSPDSAASHDKFKAAHNLNFQLVSDPDKKICEEYGVWVEKSMYGRKYMGVDRSTFIIDPRGTVTHVFRKVKVPGHVESIIKILQN